MKKIIALFVIAWAGASNALPSYEIVKNEKMGNIKRSVEVVLDQRATASELEEIANAIYKSGFKNTFITYSIANETKGMAWASTHFNPSLKVKILGSTIDEHHALSTLKVTDNQKDIFGSWRAHYGFEYKIIFKEKADGLTITTIFANGAIKEEPLKISIVKNQKRYFTENDAAHGEYFTIDKNGDLQFWGNQDNYYTAPRES